MNKCTVLATLLLLAPASMAQQGFPSYYAKTDLSLASPGALKFGLYGYDNPALLTYVRQTDLMFSWADAPGRWNDFNRWGLFFGAPHFGFSVNKEKAGNYGIADYQLSFAAGDRTASFGFAYGWSAGNRTYFERSNIFKLGTLLRPDPYLSFGLTGTAATNGSAQEAVADIAGRPFGNELVTVFADCAIRNGQLLNHAPWSMGAVVEALPGLRVTGRYFDSKAFALGVELSLGRLGVSTQSHYDSDHHHGYNTYSIRLGAFDRSLLQKLDRRGKSLEMNLNGRLRYQRYILFDRSNTLLSLLTAIDAAREDDRVSGIAINTSGMDADREMLWELRERLADFKSAGKSVIVFIDRPSIEEYQFATVADKIVLDPTGMILLGGFLSGRTYFKGTLEKLGIGFDEWRFFKYKSADETFSRDSMSAADREQLQAYVEERYRVAKEEICEGRHFSAAKFDTLLNGEVAFLPDEAVGRGLVDLIGRWEDVRHMIRETGEKGTTLMGQDKLLAFNRPYDDRWGEPPRIAIVYAIGVCAMDEGINARSLVKDMEAAGNDSKVKAVVLRVDSPGGDAMASDYIAEAVTKVRKTKPVIVSQGAVAASGGYWLSMNADTIVSAPTTVTGSIGVIGGWFYNKGLKEYLGISTDYVKAGEHADLGFGFRFPLIGIQLPDRNLTPAERTKVEGTIKAYYRMFIDKVAAGRSLSIEAVGQIAQGRIWTGTAAKRNGLVDVLGGMVDAIRIAKAKAGLCDDCEVTYVEYPKPGLFDFSRLAPRFFGIDEKVREDPTVEQLKFRMEHNGEPLPLLPLEEMDLE